jgi:hypothetical protein
MAEVPAGRSMSTEFRVVDRVARETGKKLAETDSILAHDDEETFVLEEVEDGE